MSAQLPGILRAFSPALDRYGYAAVIGLVGVEGLGIPAPGQTILIAAGLYAGAVRLNLIIVLAAGLLAAVGGDNFGYAIGHYGGRPLVMRFVATCCSPRIGSPPLSASSPDTANSSCQWRGSLTGYGRRTGS
jgi:hypothetical protein